MLDHIVLLKLKRKTTKNQIEALYKNVLNLKSKISGIISISVGNNNSLENKNHGFTCGFVVRFVDSTSRDNYLLHLEHLKAAKKYILPIVDDILVFDYNIQS